MKRHTSKIIAVILVLSFLMIAGCTGETNKPSTDTPTSAPDVTIEPKPEETPAVVEKPDPYSPMAELITLTTGASLPAEPKYPEGESIENNDVLKWLKDNMNIEVKYEWTTSDQNNAYDERLGLLIASNAIPDFVSLGGANSMHMLKKLIESDMILDVTQLYEDYASPTFKEMHSASDNVALKPVTFGDKLMAIPSLADMETAAAVIWYRKDMLDKAGLQPPKTVDDVINIVKVLNEKGVTDNAVLPARADMPLLSGDTASFDWLFSAYNAYPGMMIEDKDGKVVYGSVQPEVKEALATAQQMYKDGVIPQDFALWDGNKAVELISSNKVGIFMGAWWSTWWPLQDSIKNDSNVQWEATLIQSKDGKYYQRGYSAQRGFLVIRNGVEHPEAIMKLINIGEDCSLKKNGWYNELKWNEGAKYFTTAGALLPPLPSAKYLDEISRRYNAIMDVVEGRVQMEDTDPETAQLAASVIKEREQPLADIGNWAQAVSWTEGAATFAEFNMIQKIPAFDGTTETLMKTNALLTDLEKQTFLKIIMNEASVDEFDTFVGQWYSLGGETVLQEINAIVK